MAGKYSQEAHQKHRPARRSAEANERLMNSRDQVEIWSAPTWLWRTYAATISVVGSVSRVEDGGSSGNLVIEMGKVHAGVKSKRRSRISMGYHAAPLTSFWFLVAKQPPARVLSKHLGRLKGKIYRGEIFRPHRGGSTADPSLRRHV
jgi:hypothetical protein